MRFLRFAGPAFAACGLAFALGGCAGVTYGTGTRAELQTIEDLTSITSLGGKKTADIEYKPRGGIVVPPTANLPPVADGKKKVADANWPVDQDEMARKIKKDNAAAAAAGQAQGGPGQDPGFRLPKGATKTTTATTGDKEGFKQLAAAKGAKSGTYDENGRPVRRFLTEPPSEYREGDPSAPMDAPPEKKKKKFLFF